MGNLISTVTPVRANVAGIQSYVAEIPDITYEKSLGTSRFLKTIRCKHQQGTLVCKIFIKHDPEISLKKYLDDLKGVFLFYNISFRHFIGGHSKCSETKLTLDFTLHCVTRK